MLVKRSIVEKWYRTDSWVYRNFAYLFVNPLWAKRVPTGFSVCPYFWLNLFSLFIFRPLFVAPIRYILLPILKLLGKPASIVDEFLFKILHRIGFIKDPTFAKGVGTFAGLLFVITITLLGLVSFLIVAGLIQLHGNMDGTTGLFAYWSSLSFITLLSTIGIHKLITESECKTMYYIYIWGLAFLISMFIFVPQETFQVIGEFSGEIKLLFVEIGIGLGIAATFLGHYLWAATKYFFVWTPVKMFYVPWWVYILGISLAGFLVDRIFSYADKRYSDYLWEKDKERLYNKFRHNWIDLFIKVLTMSKAWKYPKELFNNNYDIYTARACLVLKHTIYEKAFDYMWKDLLDTVQNTYPTLKPNGLTTCKVESLDSRFVALGTMALQTPVTIPKIDSYGLWTAISEVCKSDPELKAQIKELVDTYRLQDKCKEERRRARKNSFSHRLCLKATAAIGTVVKSIFNGIGHIIVQIGTFFVYLWILIKAKKQGACPYFKFVESNQKEQ